MLFAAQGRLVDTIERATAVSPTVRAAVCGRPQDRLQDGKNIAPVPLAKDVTLNGNSRTILLIKSMKTVPLWDRSGSSDDNSL
jgi:hypothetical protein